MPTYLSTDPNAGLDEAPKYLSTDTNAGLGDSKYLSTDPQAGLPASQDTQGSVQTGDAAGDAYMKRVAELNKKPAESLPPSEMARTGMTKEEPGTVTGGTEQDPINQQGLVPPGLIQAGYKASPLYWAGKLVAPKQTEDISKGLSESVAGFTSPNNLALLATAPLMPEGIAGKVAGTALGAYFEAQQIKADPAEVAELRDAYAKGDLKTVTKVVSELGIGHVLPLLAALHADVKAESAKPETLTPQEEVTPQGQAAPSKPEAPPIQRVSPETGQTFYDYGEKEPPPQASAPPPVATEEPAQTPQKPTPEPQTPQDAVGSDVDSRPVETTTGVANRVFESEAQAGKIGEVEPGEGMSWQEMVDRGRDLLNKGADPQMIARRLGRTGRISPDDFAVLRAERERLNLETTKAEQAVRDNPNDPQAQNIYNQARQTETDWIRNVVQPAKTATSDIFRGMQGEAPVDTSTFAGLRRAVLDQKGRDVAPREVAQLETRARKVKEAQQAESQAVQKLGAQIDRSTAKVRLRSVDELKAEMAKMAEELLPCK